MRSGGSTCAAPGACLPAPAVKPELLAQLARARLRPSPARLRLLNMLDQCRGRWMGVEEIFLGMSQYGGSEGIANIYRNLKDLEQAGLVQRTWGDGHTRTRVVYRLPAGPADEDVVALVCEVCNRQLALLDPALRDALAKAMGEREGKAAMPVAVQVVCVEPPCFSLADENRVQEASSQ